MILNHASKGGRNDPHYWEADDNQFKRAKYDENNFASMKHSVCSQTPYGYKEDA